jgi:hypothetical protein
MLVGFTKHSGQGDAGGRKVVGYMTADEWPKEVERQAGTQIIKEKVLEKRIPPPEVLRGDPQLMRDAINVVPHERRYQSGVLSFAHEDISVACFNSGDASERARVAAVMDDFEETVFAGLDRQHRPPVLWTTHTHLGRLELNFVMPRAVLVGDDLRSFNPDPPGEGNRDLWIAFRDKWNHDERWADPEAPERARVLSLPDHILKSRAILNRVDLTSRIDVREQINSIVERQVREGLIKDRADVVRTLREYDCQITREGRDYLGIRPEGAQKTVRLKGDFFAADFRADRWLEQHPIEGVTQELREVRARQLATGAERLEVCKAQRAEWMRDKYQDRLDSLKAERDAQTTPINLDAKRVKFPRPEKVASDIIEENIDVRAFDRSSRRAPPEAVRPDSAQRGRGRVSLPRAVQDRRALSRLGSEGPDDLRSLSRRHVDRRAWAPARVLRADARHDLGDGRPEHMAGVRRSGERDRGDERARGEEGERPGLDQQRRRKRRPPGLRGDRPEAARESRTGYQAVLFEERYGLELGKNAADSIAYIDIKTGWLATWDGAQIQDEGDRITATRLTDTSLILMVAEIKAKGWAEVQLEGVQRDKDALWLALRKEGIEVTGHEPADAIKEELEEWSKARADSQAETPAVPPAAAEERAEMRRRTIKRYQAAPIETKEQFDENVELIKRKVDLRRELEADGWVENKRKNAVGDAKRWHTYERNGLHLIVGRGDDGHWAYHETDDKIEPGTVYDYLRIERGMSFGQAHGYLKPQVKGLAEGRAPRAELRSDDMARRNAEAVAFAERQERERVAAIEAERQWEAAREDIENGWLMRERFIKRETLQAEIFKDQVRTARQGFPTGHAVFPYRSETGDLIAVESRNAALPGSEDTYKNYTKEAGVGIWTSTPRPTDRAIVFTESPIDAMSHYQELDERRRSIVRYAAVRRGVSDEQVRAVIRQTPPGTQIVAAFDNDETGQKKYTTQLQRCAAAEGREADFVSRPPPPQVNDWNQLTQEKGRAEAKTQGLTEAKSAQLRASLEAKAKAEAEAARAAEERRAAAEAERQRQLEEERRRQAEEQNRPRGPRM